MLLLLLLLAGQETEMGIFNSSILKINVRA
jgi:hypothetical protein